jgi:hypothetical protein
MLWHQHYLTFSQATFLDDQIDVDHAREHGHMHLSEVNDDALVTFSLPCYDSNELWDNSDS